MMKLNNKGQSLVLFVLLIPVILGIVALVFDLGNALTKKNEIDNVIEMVLESELNSINIEQSDVTIIDNNIKKESIEVLLDYNLSDVEFDVETNDSFIKIIGNTYVNGVFSNILNIKGFKIVSEYNCYLESKYIEKVK